jgi:hypothetical protein
MPWQTAESVLDKSIVKQRFARVIGGKVSPHLTVERGSTFNIEP